MIMRLQWTITQNEIKHKAIRNSYLAVKLLMVCHNILRVDYRKYISVYSENPVNSDTVINEKLATETLPSLLYS